MFFKRTLRIFIFFLFILVFAGSVLADGSSLLQPYVNYFVDKPHTVGVGDFNNDGFSDAAVTNNDGELKVFLQNVNGTLASPVTYSAGSRPESLTVGDLNGDSRDDIVVTNFSTDVITVFLQQLNGTLANGVTYATGDGPDSVAVGDVNEDGLDDVVVSNWNSDFISVLIQNGSGTLNSKVDYATPRAGYDDIEIADVNNDDRNDVIKMNGQGLNPNLSVFLQNVNGTLALPVSYSVSNCSSFCSGSGIDTGDVTGDGLIDVVLSYGGNRPTSKIAVFAQALDGSLQASVAYAAYDIPEPVEVADVNEDGLADVVTVHGGWNRVSVYLQQLNGTLSSYSLYSLRTGSGSHYKPQGLAIGDLNQDTLPDILVANYNFGLDVFYHVPPDITPPTVTSIVRANPNPTSASIVSFLVTFSENVSGVDVSDFSLNVSGITGATVSGISGSGIAYTVSVSTGNGTGTIRLDVADDDTVADGSDNKLGGTNAGNGNFTNGQFYTLNRPTLLVNSVLPTSRTIMTGTMATIFTTVINAGSNTASGITLSIDPSPAGTFTYYRTNCSTNTVISGPNPVLDLAPSGVLCYVLSFVPTAPFAATNMHIQANANNAPSTSLLTGVNTWLLRSTGSLGPDIIALTTTTDFHQLACSGTSAFAVALSNVSIAAIGDISVVAHTGTANLPLTISISETHPSTGDIIGDEVLQNLSAGDNRTVAVFVTFEGCVSFDAASNRIFIEFRDHAGNVVGSTSTAVSTNR